MININLLPPELKMKRIEAKRNASLISICLVIVIIFAVLGVLARSFETTISGYLGTAKVNIDKETSDLDQYQDFKNLALLINDRRQTTDEIDKTRVIWSQVLQELNYSVPSEIQFESLIVKFDKSPNFVLQGNTTNDREIIKFKEKLEDSLFFKDVSFKTSSLTGEKANQKLTFTLEFNLEKNNSEEDSAQKEIK